MTDPRVTVRWEGTRAIACLPQEIDLLNVAAVREELGALVGAAPGALIADMTQTGFCDSAGIAAIIQVAKEAAAAGVPFRLAASAIVLRLLNLLTADQVLAIYPSLAAAVAGDAAPDGIQGG